MTKAIKAKFPRIPLVIGGVLATTLPRQVMEESGADIVVKGEGEIAFARILNGEPLEKIPGLVYRTPEGEIRESLGRSEQLRTVDEIPPPGNVSDDPLAPAAEPDRAIPVIEDYGRPVEIGLKAAKQLHDAGAALFIDAREDWEYAEGHIPGAINLPYEQAITDPDRLEKIDQGGKPIVTYCGGGSCEISISVAWELLGVGN